MKSVTVVNHPLVQHKLTIMRDRETSTASFRRLLREIAVISSTLRLIAKPSIESYSGSVAGQRGNSSSGSQRIG